jgi:hypothetical protein
MNKIFLAFPLMLLSLLFIWCTKIDGNIEYNSGIDLTWSDYAKLSYLLEWVIDVKKDEANIWNKPLSSDEQKWTFIFNILNNNYMDKYENEVEAPETPYYPVLNDSFIDNDWDVHDSVFPIDRDVKLVYKKSDIDNFMNETFWDTLKDWNRIKQSWMILSWNNYIFFTYLYYWSDLIWNKWRTTLFEIDNINSASDKDIEVKAKYYDDILSWDDFEDSECKITYHISKNPKSFFWFMINEYKYEWCEINSDYLAPDLPSQIIYWFDNWIFNDYIWLKKEFRSEEINVDLNNDWIDEFFRIWVDSPNWSQVLWLVWDKWYNFIYDFSWDVVDDYNELKDWLFIDMYFEDLDWDDIKEVIVAIWDKETWSQVNIYQLWLDNWFELLWKIYWRSYLEYDIDSMVIHAPYSNNWVCQTYQLINWKVTKLII